MPLYEFECAKGHITTMLSPVEQCNRPPRFCGSPKCTSHAFKRNLSATPTTFVFADREHRIKSKLAQL